MIKYVGYVIAPDIIEDVFIISFDTDNVEKSSHRGKIAYRVRPGNIIESQVYYSHNGDTQRWINDEFYMEVYSHEAFDIFKKAQKDIMKGMFE